VDPAPYDENELDIHQAFFEVRCYRSSQSVTARIGRQELYYGSRRLVDARFGLNTRISFDGVKLIVPTQHSKIEIFATRPTLQRPGIFDDPPGSKTLFWGVYSTTPVHESASLDAYYLGYKAASQTFAVGTGIFQSNTFGGRLAGRHKRYDYDTEINAQVGTFQGGDVRAWSASSMNGFTTTKKAWSPRVSLRSDITSGDNNPADRHLGTFFPLYARGKYFGEAELNGPINTVDVIPALDLHPGQDVLVISYGSFWRESIRDGLYGFAGNLYKPANQSDARFIGQQAEVDINYSVAPHTLLRVVYQHFFAGEYLMETPPGKNVNYATAWLDYHF
jgi:hypothetical protein